MLLYEMFGIGIAVVLVVAAIGGLAARGMLGQEGMGMRRPGGAAAAWPLTARAQQPAMPVIGFLAGPTAKGRESLIAAFQKGLTEVGYSEGRNIVIESRWAEGQFDRLPAMANELVQRKVAV